MRAHAPQRTGFEQIWFDGVLRTTGLFNFIDWWDFAPERTREIVRREADHFRSLRRDVEWRVYGHDQPAGLEMALADEGFESQEQETLVAAEASGEFNPPPSPGAEIRRVLDEPGLVDYVAVLHAAFGDDKTITLDGYRTRLADPGVALFIAYVGGSPAAAGRLGAAADRQFAGLWDGATAPKYRGRGLYRALVGVRAAEAQRRGARFVYVDARETSRRILQRLGFEPLVTKRGWELKGEA
jgi:GNAT superfamily N-acetyltransferase